MGHSALNPIWGIFKRQLCNLVPYSAFFKTVAVFYKNTSINLHVGMKDEKVQIESMENETNGISDSILLHKIRS